VNSIPESCRRTCRRRAANKWRVFAAMRDGATLHCGQGHDGIAWWLSTAQGDQFVPRQTVDDLLYDPHVVPVGDALGSWGTSQTWRWTDDD
jgi:hypothetical protein